MSVVNFYSPYGQITLKNRNALKEFICSVFLKEKKNLISLQFIFCSDAYLLNINQQFLQHDYYTDIITFNLGTEKGIEGEVYISIERVRENARTMKTRFTSELHRVIFHGVLHLCGYKDKLKPDMLKMRNKEDCLLALYFRD